MDGHLWLIGMMGAGKSAVGGLLARRLGVAFIDTDVEVEQRAGVSIAQLWESEGEDAFREFESLAVAGLQRMAPAVIATGGGVIMDPRNVAAMRASGHIVWLQASPATLAERVGDGSGRPLLTGDTSQQRLAAVLDARIDSYGEAAEVVLSTEDATVEDVVERIEVWWNATS